MIRNKFRLLVLSLVALCGLTFAAAPVITHADTFKDDACGGLNSLDGSNGGCNNGSDNQVGNIIRVIVNILSVIIGIVAVVMIIMSGYRYIVSSGDSSQVGSAKNTIIYAVIGLVLVALAQIIVNVTISKANVINNPCPSNSSISSTDTACK